MQTEIFLSAGYSVSVFTYYAPVVRSWFKKGLFLSSYKSGDNVGKAVMNKRAKVFKYALIIITWKVYFHFGSCWAILWSTTPPEQHHTPPLLLFAYMYIVHIHVGLFTQTLRWRWYMYICNSLLWNESPTKYMYISWGGPAPPVYIVYCTAQNFEGYKFQGFCCFPSKHENEWMASHLAINYACDPQN